MTNTDRLAQALLPCPFCGRSDLVTVESFTEEHGCNDGDTRWNSGCRGCGASFEEDTKQEAVASWNRRAALASLAPAAVSPALTEMSSEGDFVVHDCLHCHKCVTYSRKSADSWVAYRDLTAQVAALTVQCATAGNYVCDKEVCPTSVRFADGRVVRLAHDADHGYYLEIERES
jgi:Lar family restriction alleviation protein